MDLLGRYVEPNKQISVEVVNEHLDLVKKEAAIMYKLCSTKNNLHKAAYAIAHSQINKTRPLRFFVTFHGEIVINPRIIRHTNTEIIKTEGCMSFPDKQPTLVNRWHKIEAEYQCIENEKLSEVKIIKLKGLEAEVWQHEIDHMNGKYIFQI